MTHRTWKTIEIIGWMLFWMDGNVEHRHTKTWTIESWEYIVKWFWNLDLKPLDGVETWILWEL